MDNEALLICSDCACESTESTVEECTLGGWTENEYGALCPGCAGEHIETGGSEGMAAVAEVFGLKKKGDPKVTMAVAFDAQVNPGPMGGCVDFDSDYLEKNGGVFPSLELPPPKPDTFVQAAPKKRGRPRKNKE